MSRTPAQRLMPPCSLLAQGRPARPPVLDSGQQALDWMEFQRFAELFPWLRLEMGLDHVAGRDVLVLGCGDPLDLVAMARRGARVHALSAHDDHLRVAAELCRQLGLDVNLERGEVGALPYRDESFDLVYGFEGWIVGMGDGSCVDELRRVARPGARIRLVGLRRSPLTRAKDAAGARLLSRLWKRPVSGAEVQSQRMGLPLTACAISKGRARRLIAHFGDGRVAYRDFNHPVGSVSLSALLRNLLDQSAFWHRVRGQWWWGPARGAYRSRPVQWCRQRWRQVRVVASQGLGLLTRLAAPAWVSKILVIRAVKTGDAGSGRGPGPGQG